MSPIRTSGVTCLNDLCRANCNYYLKWTNVPTIQTDMEYNKDVALITYTFLTYFSVENIILVTVCKYDN